MNYVEILEELLHPHIKEALLARGITENQIKIAIKEAKADKKATFDYSCIKSTGGCEMGQL